MKKFKIKTGDLVRVISGEHKNEEGKILSVDFSKDKVIVEGVNLVSKHTKPSTKSPQGGIIKKEAPIHVSNVALIDAETKKTTRVGFRVEGDKKVRFSKRSNQLI
ncbi:MAG: 50S ribosomal protein L24 [Flavobacteriaceae bacterium]|nr:50S ribosomal protein L24 [Bacteroidota bacterium]MDT8414868.1 50S ribosomal protein L24 [Flavobacteriaceae bacterium]